jgi:hypothetical protein
MLTKLLQKKSKKKCDSCHKHIAEEDAAICFHGADETWLCESCVERIRSEFIRNEMNARND